MQFYIHTHTENYASFFYFKFATQMYISGDIRVLRAPKVLYCLRWPHLIFMSPSKEPRSPLSAKTSQTGPGTDRGLQGSFHSFPGIKKKEASGSGKVDKKKSKWLRRKGHPPWICSTPGEDLRMLVSYCESSHLSEEHQSLSALGPLLNSKTPRKIGRD